ncbi:MAG: histone H1 [Pseudomonadota bacterium]|nr:histone H1 [Gammaproteobacteria bacterium]MDQ3581710.1 histone H1 [Pseudomonadota bacterium]
MPNRSSKPPRPRDPNQRAKLIVDLATGQVEDKDPNEGKNPAAVKLGRAGGLKGGPARAASMTPEERRKAASKAGRARWGKKASE